jgi:hypothetical protein
VSVQQVELSIFSERRSRLSAAMDGEPVFLSGHKTLPRNFAANVYRFWQDSSFLYFCGLSRPRLRHGNRTTGCDAQRVALLHLFSFRLLGPHDPDHAHGHEDHEEERAILYRGGRGEGTKSTFGGKDCGEACHGSLCCEAERRGVELDAKINKPTSRGR